MAQLVGVVKRLDVDLLELAVADVVDALPGLLDALLEHKGEAILCENRAKVASVAVPVEDAEEAGALLLVEVVQGTE